jgi:hypothetical protein
LHPPRSSASAGSCRSDQWGPWSFAHGLFAALDLAQDRARGAEILESWNPSSIVSGEPIVLAGDANGNAARLVRATAGLGDADLGPHALVGGLAVMCRLAAVHRATQDVDTVTETTAPTAVEVIATSIGQHDPSSPSRAVVEGSLPT